LFMRIAFKWSNLDIPGARLYYTEETGTYIKDLIDGLQPRLARIKLDVTIPPERLPKVFIYSTSDQVRTALVRAQQWTGAVAFPYYNIILTAVDRNSLEWAKGTIAHEITHLEVGELVFGPYQLPTWLKRRLGQIFGR